MGANREERCLKFGIYPSAYSPWPVYSKYTIVCHYKYRNRNSPPYKSTIYFDMIRKWGLVGGPNYNCNFGLIVEEVLLNIDISMNSIHYLGLIMEGEIRTNIEQQLYHGNLAVYSTQFLNPITIGLIMATIFSFQSGLWWHITVQNTVSVQYNCIRHQSEPFCPSISPK